MGGVVSIPGPNFRDEACTRVCNCAWKLHVGSLAHRGSDALGPATPPAFFRVPARPCPRNSPVTAPSQVHMQLSLAGVFAILAPARLRTQRRQLS